MSYEYEGTFTCRCSIRLKFFLCFVPRFSLSFKISLRSFLGWGRLIEEYNRRIHAGYMNCSGGTVPKISRPYRTPLYRRVQIKAEKSLLAQMVNLQNGVFLASMVLFRCLQDARLRKLKFS